MFPTRDEADTDAKMADDDLPVVRLAADQRQPASDDEPRCVVCASTYTCVLCMRSRD